MYSVINRLGAYKAKSAYSDLCNITAQIVLKQIAGLGHKKRNISTNADDNTHTGLSRSVTQGIQAWTMSSTCHVSLTQCLYHPCLVTVFVLPVNVTFKCCFDIHLTHRM